MLKKKPVKSVKRKYKISNPTSIKIIQSNFASLKKRVLKNSAHVNSKLEELIDRISYDINFLNATSPEKLRQMNDKKLEYLEKNLKLLNDADISLQLTLNDLEELF